MSACVRHGETGLDRMPGETRSSLTSETLSAHFIRKDQPSDYTPSRRHRPALQALAKEANLCLITRRTLACRHGVRPTSGPEFAAEHVATAHNSAKKTEDGHAPNTTQRPDTAVSRARAARCHWPDGRGAACQLRCAAGGSPIIATDQDWRAPAQVRPVRDPRRERIQRCADCGRGFRQPGAGPQDPARLARRAVAAGDAA